MRIIFVADFFAEQVLGGGELNNEELITILKTQEHEIAKINSSQVTAELIRNNKDCKFIIANFAHLHPQVIPEFYDLEYIIYEHDHKYLSTRNPGVFPDFKAPPEHIVNLEFYQRANAVLCQSKFHVDIAHMNTELGNLVNLGGNIWDLETLEFLKTMSEVEKNDTYAIMDSTISHKNTGGAIKYCKHKNYKYNLIASQSYKEFITMMSRSKSLVFIPQTPETLSRVVVEARMMNMGVVTNKMIGAASEPWYRLKGHELIDIMIQKRTDITNTVLENLG